MKQLCLMASKINMVLLFGFVDANMTFVVSISLGISHSRLLCIIFNKFLILNMKDPW